MKVTLKQLAKKVNCDISTVSRVVNNKPNRVSKETREKILKMAQKMEYIPNLNASNLANGRTKTIGVAVTELDNPVRSSFVAKLRQLFSKNNYQLLIVGLGTGDDQKSICELISRGIDGLVVGSLAGVLDEHPLWNVIQLALKHDIATVVFGMAFSNQVDSVIIDYGRGAEMLTTHLIDQGYKDIVYMGSGEVFYRQHAYSKTMKAAGLKPVCVNMKSSTMEGGRSGIQEYLKKNDLPQAIIARNDLGAIGVIAGLRMMGIKVPEDIGVVGFDNIEIADFMNPRLTSIGFDSTEKSQIIYNMLSQRIKMCKGIKQASLKHAIKGEIFIRESCGARIRARQTN